MDVGVSRGDVGISDNAVADAKVGLGGVSIAVGAAAAVQVANIGNAVTTASTMPAVRFIAFPALLIAT